MRNLKTSLPAIFATMCVAGLTGSASAQGQFPDPANRAAGAPGAAAGEPAVRVGSHVITVTSKVTLLPGSSEELKSLPVPLSVIDPSKDFDQNIVRKVAFERTTEDVRRMVAAKMAVELKDRSRWVLREMTWPTDIAGQGTPFTVTAVFDRGDAVGAPDAAVHKAQEEMFRLFGPVKVLVAYEVQKSNTRGTRLLIDKANAELLRGPWAGMPHTVMDKGEDPARLVARVGKDCDLLFRVGVGHVTVSVNTTAGDFYKCTGHLSLSVYLKGPDGKWVQVHQQVMPNTPDEKARTGSDTDYEVGGQFSSAAAEDALHSKLGEQLITSGRLFDAANRAFSKIFGDPKAAPGAAPIPPGRAPGAPQVPGSL